MGFHSLKENPEVPIHAFAILCAPFRAGELGNSLPGRSYPDAEADGGRRHPPIVRYKRRDTIAERQRGRQMNRVEAAKRSGREPGRDVQDVIGQLDEIDAREEGPD